MTVTNMMEVVTKRMVGRIKRMAGQRGEMCISGFSHVDHWLETVGLVDQVDQGKWNGNDGGNLADLKGFISSVGFWRRILS